MRKILPIILTLIFSVSLFAQTHHLKMSGVKNETFVKKEIINPTGAPCVQVVRPEHSGKGPVLSKVEIGMSTNPYTLLIPGSTCLAVNTDLNLINFTARTNSATYYGNHVGAYFSVDGGNTFDNTLMEPWQIPVANYISRYPSGVIYNPAGNIDLANAYVVVAGPMLTPDSAGSWGGSYFASQKFDGSAPDQQYTIYGVDMVNGYNNMFPRDFMQAHGDKFFILGNGHLDNGVNYTTFRTIINAGAWQSGAVSWSRYALDPDFALDPAGLPEGYYSACLAMDDNGQNGYIIETGRNPDATSNITFQPIIFKTTDGGQNWTKQTFNWEQIPSLVDIATQLSDVARPHITPPMDAVIDVNGELHFSVFVHGAASDHVDSLGYYAVYTLWKGIVYDIHQTSTGWDAFVVDTVFAADADAYPFTDTDTDERFQMSRSADGGVIAYAWADTDPTYDAENKFPDINVRLYNVIDGLMGPRENITKNTEVDAMAMWMYLGDHIFDNGNWNYTIPLTISEHGAADTEPVTHYYLNGITLTVPAYPVGVQENVSEGINCGIYPNPATDIVNVEISSRVNDNFTINIYNAVSSLVMSKQIAVNGKVKQTIDVTTLPAGLYMVEVTGNNGTVVRKMIKK